MKTRIFSFLLFSSLAVSAQTVRDFELKDIENNTQSYAELKGEKLTLIDFWATWCRPCAKAIPELNIIYNLYKDKGVNIIGVNGDGPRSISKVAPFSRSMQIKFPILLDINGDVRKELNVISFPTLLMVDAKGKVVWVHEGFIPGDEQQIIAEIEKHL